MQHGTSTSIYHDNYKVYNMCLQIMTFKCYLITCGLLAKVTTWMMIITDVSVKLA